VASMFDSCRSFALHCCKVGHSFPSVAHQFTLLSARSWTWKENGFVSNVTCVN